MTIEPKTTAERDYQPLPKPAFKLWWDGGGARYIVSKPNIGDTDVFTEVEMHAYYDLGREAGTKDSRPVLHGWRLHTDDSEGRRWLHITTPHGASASLSCALHTGNGHETIAAQVIHYLCQALAASPTAQAAPAANPECEPIDGPIAQATPGLSEQDAGLLEQGASMLEALSGDERNRGNDSAAMGADCSAHAVRRLAAKLLAAPAAEGDALEPDYRERWDAELGRTAMLFVDRAGDPHPGIDDAETICAEFYAAMSAVIERMPHVERMNAAIDAARAQAKEGNTNG